MPPPDRDPNHPTGLAGYLRLARWALAWESLWPALVPPLGLAGVFVALALFDVLPLLPGWLHALVLLAFAVAIVFAVWRGFRRLGWPDQRAAARRLERDSGLAHRPLEALDDVLAGGGDDPLTRSLWRAHRRRMVERLGRLRLALPSPGMAARDPLGLRAAVILLLVVAAAAGGAEAPKRLVSALTPAISPPGFAASVEVWVTPPAYTGLAPMALRAGDDKPVAVPAGSAVTAALAGGWGAAELAVDGGRVAFERLPDGGQRVESRITRSGRLAVRQAWREVAGWPVTAIVDALPSVQFAEPPMAGDRGRMRFAVTASDDYGVSRLWVEITRPDAPGLPPLTVDLGVPGVRPRTVDAVNWLDLTAQPWAGLPVNLRPMAEDTAGQIAGGEAVAVVLPERDFDNPVARAILEQRRLVTEDRTNARAAVSAVDDISGRPQDLRDDLAVFLSLRMARHLLADDEFDLDEVRDLLWNAALRLEEGAFAGAERRLEDALAALERALAGDAPAATLKRLLDEFQAALEEMAEAAGGEAGQDPAAPDDRVIGEDELNQLLDTMRGMAETGSRDALKRMLDDLSQLMAGMRNAPAANPAAAKAASELRGLARRQRELLDQSFQEGRRSPSADGTAAAQAQRVLRDQLADTVRRLEEAVGPAPEALGDASAAMGEAALSLAGKAWDQAAEAQSLALQRLEDGAQRMASQGRGAARRDPFGRALPSRAVGDDGATRVPEAGEVQQARRILDELRRRAGEWRRPEPERDYLHRLLKEY